MFARISRNLKHRAASFRHIPPLMSKQQDITRFFGGSPVCSKRNNEAIGLQAKKRHIDETKSIEKEEAKENVVSKENVLTKETKEVLAEVTSQSKQEEKRIAEVSREEDVANETTQQAIPYHKLTDVFDKIETESSRLKITSIIQEFFLEILTTASPQDLVKVVYLSINRLGPDYEANLELGLGETLLIKAISECYGRAPSKVKADYQEVGDLGLVAQKSKAGQRTMFKPKALQIDAVFEELKKIAKSTGKDSQAKKIGTIIKMLTACDNKSEAKYLVRSLEGKLRIGLAEKTVLAGVAQAFMKYELQKNGTEVSPQALTQIEDNFKEAFSQLPNYEILIMAAYDHGTANLLKYCQITPGVPLKPMLAKPTKSISEVLDRFQDEEFTSEYKYDGERAQIHLLPDGEIKIYSRNSEDMSGRYPDLVPIIKELCISQPNSSMILDCEAVAWDRETKKILPFQVLSTRKRKDVNEADIRVHICIFAFDLLYFNEPLITKTLKERREIMYEFLKPIEGRFQYAEARVTSSIDELQGFLDQSVEDSCEGLMVKMLNGSESYYEPSKRSRNWLKLKKDYLLGIGDSLDLVVVGAYIGRGKRTGGYGGFLLASYNNDSGEYETTCKIGTGFSEEDLATLSQRLKPTEIGQPKPYYVYDTTNSNAIPDVWFEPKVVFEVLTADLSLSPIYKAAHQEYGRGISLRFPRFLKLREDKGIEDATTSVQVAELYQAQASVK